MAAPPSETGTASRHTYASDPNANSSASSRTTPSLGASGNQSGRTTNSAVNANKAASHKTRRANNPAMPATSNATYKRNSIGNVHSDPLTSCGNGLAGKAPGNRYTISQPSAT